MDYQVSSTRCTVTIVAPSGQKIVFESDAPQEDLLAVETEKDLQNAVGSFHLTFAPTIDESGRTWDERIPVRSLVTISMERLGESEMPDVNPIVMVGLTDQHQRSEDWRGTQPGKRIVVGGREIACVMLDAELWFHPALEGQAGVLSPAVAMVGLENLRLQWQPDLAGVGDDPRVTLEVILRYFLLGGSTASATATTEDVLQTTPETHQDAVINLQLPERSLASLLVLKSDVWTLFEDGVTVAIANNHPYIGSVWNYLHIFIDEAFQEFFTRIEHGVSTIHFRGKPFVHEPVTSGTRFLENVSTLETLPLTPPWIISSSLTVNSSAVFNVFWVQPMGMTQFMERSGLKWQIPPEIITEPEHISFVGRWGLRVMNVGSPYIPAWKTPGAGPGAGTPAGTSALPVTAKAPLPTSTPTTLPPIDPAKMPTSVRIPTSGLTQSQQYYASLSAQIAREEGVPEDMIPSFVANIEQESGFNPLADTGKGDRGIAQFTAGAQETYGLANPFDPVASLHAGARYWLDLTKRFGRNPDLVAAGYNAGPGAVAAAGNQVPASAQTHVGHVKRRLAKYLPSGTPSSAPLTTPPTNVPARVAQPATATPAPPSDTPGTPIGVIAEVATRWAKYLRAWYDAGPLLAVGSFQVRGHPAWNVGHRLLLTDERGEREFYLEGVSHRYEMRTGLYLTQLRVTRGWWLPNVEVTLHEENAGQGDVEVTIDDLVHDAKADTMTQRPSQRFSFSRAEEEG